MTKNATDGVDLKAATMERVQMRGDRRRRQWKGGGEGDKRERYSQRGLG